MKKTKYIILSIVLCFSLAFVVYPLRTFADGDLTYGESGVTIGSLGGGITVIPTVTIGNFGQTPEAWTIDWTGQSETTFAADPSLGGYIYTPPAEEPEEEEPEEKDKGWCCTCNGVMSQCYSCTKTGNYNTKAQCEACCPCGTYKYCRKSNWSWLTGNQTLYCIGQKGWCEVNPGNECKVDADCEEPSTITPTIEPSQAQYRCRQCRGEICSIRYSPTPCSDTCRTNANCREPTTIFNQPPSAINLPVSQPDYCSVSWAVAIFSWKFTDPDGDSQSAYQIQVDNNSNFSSSEVDTGKVPSVIPNNSYGSYATLPGKLSWNTTYYWRLKVWDSKDLFSSWISDPSFTTPVHVYPIIDFSWNPQNPATNEIVQFTDGSTVFGGATKQSWLWTFQDGSPANSSIQNATTTFASTDSKNVSLRVRDSSNFECTGSKSVNIRLPLPEYKEVPPTIWLKKFFAGIINFFDGFLKI